MNKFLPLLFISLLGSCITNEKPDTEVTLKVIHDTIRLTETKWDTLIVYQPKIEDTINPEYYILSRLPDNLIDGNLLEKLNLQDEYLIDDRLNPFYLEADFNGDGHLDIALHVSHINSKKVGFAIIHGVTNEIHIIGAGNAIKNWQSDDLEYVDIWKINRRKINEPGLEEETGTGEKGELILDKPSLQIEKSELGGGQIYWNGKEYAYFHQTC